MMRNRAYRGAPSGVTRYATCRSGRRVASCYGRGVRGRLHAMVLLFWALVRTLVRILLGGGREGLGAFRANYDADQLPPVAPAEREALAGFGGCVACGLCDRGEGIRIAESRGAWRGTMSFVLAASRSMPDYPAAARTLVAVPLEALEAHERECPARVPIASLARFVLGKASEIERSGLDNRRAGSEPPTARASEPGLRTDPPRVS